MVSLFMLLISVHAFGEELICETKINTESVAKTLVSVSPKERKMFGMNDGYRFYVSNLGGAKFEIEVYNPNDASRGYAEGFIKTAEDKLGWILWSQDVILDVSCRLLTEK